MNREEFIKQNAELSARQIEWQKNRRYIFANFGDDILDHTIYMTPAGADNIYDEYFANNRKIVSLLEKLDTATKLAMNSQNAAEWAISLSAAESAVPKLFARI